MKHFTCNYFLIFFIIITTTNLSLFLMTLVIRGACRLMFIIVRNGHSYLSSNPVLGCLHFMGGTGMHRVILPPAMGK